MAVGEVIVANGITPCGTWHIGDITFVLPTTYHRNTLIGEVGGAFRETANCIVCLVALAIYEVEVERETTVFERREDGAKERRCRRTKINLVEVVDDVVTILIDVTHITCLITYAVLIGKSTLRGLGSGGVDAIGLIAEEGVGIVTHTGDDFGTIAKRSDVMLEVAEFVDGVAQCCERTTQCPTEVASLNRH